MDNSRMLRQPVAILSNATFFMIGWSTNLWTWYELSGVLDKALAFGDSTTQGTGQGNIVKVFSVYRMVFLNWQMVTRKPHYHLLTRSSATSTCCGTHSYSEYEQYIRNYTDTFGIKVVFKKYFLLSTTT